MRLSKVIYNPIITEKSTSAREMHNRYVFKVGLKASKMAIAQAVENLFEVDVEEVRTMIMPGKKRRVGRTRKFTKTPKWKKAIVTVKEGQEIKFE